MTLFGRERIDVEALRTDDYLEALLAQRDDGPVEVGRPGTRARPARAGRSLRTARALWRGPGRLPSPGSGRAPSSEAERASSPEAVRARSADAAALADPALRATIERLDRALLRVHPSFRFEERVARRLTDVAAAMRLAAAAGAEGAPVPIDLPFDPGVDPADPALVAPAVFLPSVPRPLLIGAASAALSIAGAAIVAWRFGRPADPMARAVRAARQQRGLGRPGRPARMD